MERIWGLLSEESAVLPMCSDGALVHLRNFRTSYLQAFSRSFLLASPSQACLGCVTTDCASRHSYSLLCIPFLAGLPAAWFPSHLQTHWFFSFDNSNWLLRLQKWIFHFNYYTFPNQKFLRMFNHSLGLVDSLHYQNLPSYSSSFGYTLSIWAWP